MRSLLSKPRSGESFDFDTYVSDQLAERDAEFESRRRPMADYRDLVPEPGVGLLRMNDFPYQVEWYSDEVADAEEVVWYKSTQIGMSGYAWRWSVRRCDQFGETGVYIFPTDTHVTEFGDERIEPAIEESPYLRSRIKAHFVRHKRLKRIGRGFLHLRGSNSKAGAQSVAAQFLVFDEYDYLDKSNLPQIERRISGARQLGKTPRIRRLGTPTVEGEGIHMAWEDSDKRVWMVSCNHCGLAQEITWEESVRWRNEPDGEVMRPGQDVFVDRNHVEEAWRICKACDDELDVHRGEWVAQQPGRKVIGYHVTRLIVPKTDLKQIVRASRSTKQMDVEAFENNDLGRAYSGSEMQLSMTDLMAACEMGGPMQHAYPGQGLTTMGVDVAGERDLNVRVDLQLAPDAPDLPNPRMALWIGTCKSFEEVLKLAHAFRVSQIAIDSNPERRMAKALRASFPPGTVVLVEYDDRNEADTIKITEEGPKGTPLEGVPMKVRVNRTEAFDAMMDSIRQRRNRPLLDPPPGYFDQMRAPKRRVVLDKKLRPKRVYVATGTAGDDYAHMEVYCLVATELLRARGAVQTMYSQQQGRNLPDEELGFRRVRLQGDDADYVAGFGE